MVTCIQALVAFIRMALFQDNPLAFLLSTAVLLITTSCFLAISISLHSAYLWLAVVFVALIFLATFTCTYSLPGYFVQDISTPHESDNGEGPAQEQGQSNLSFENEPNIPYWIPVDLPPAYDSVVGMNPPSYSKATGGMVKLDLIKPSNCDHSAPLRSTPDNLLSHDQTTTTIFSVL